MKLFEGDDALGEDLSKIEVDKDFVRRFEYNKNREESQRQEERKNKGLLPTNDADSDDDSSSDVSVEEEELISSKKDLQFLNALIKVKNQHPDLKKAEAKLFESDEDDSEEKVDKKKKKKNKAMYLKDVTAKHLIEGGAEFEDVEEKKKKKVKSYSEELEVLRKEFLDAADEAFHNEEEGELLKEKEGNISGDDDDDDSDAGEVEKKLDEYFGENEKLDENEMFLKEYFKNKMWVGPDEKELDNVDMDLDVSEDEEQIVKQDEYEKSFNFRFEENPGDRVLGHSRVVEGSVRKKTNARKNQRQSKEERMAQEEFKRKEELKHEKNKKKKAIRDKLNKVRETAGFGEGGACVLDEDDLEKEFDPEEYNKKMNAAFGDDYYNAADPDFGSAGDDEDEDGGELEKPNFDEEDELLGLEKGWDDVSGSEDGFSAIRKRNLKRKKEEGEEEEGKGKQIEGGVEEEEGKRKKKKKQKLSELEKEVIQKEMDEYYKLDYEDTIGDLKTRFKYRDVGARSYGLKTEEILVLDDKELNQYVSMKKIAPYREKEWVVPKNLKHKLLPRAETSNGKKKMKTDDKKAAKVEVRVENNKAREEGSNGDGIKQSRNSRRKKVLAEFKLQQSRQMAYAKIPAKSKKKSKE